MLNNVKDIITPGTSSACFCMFKSSIGVNFCARGSFYSVPQKSYIWAQFENLGELVKNTIFVA